MCSQNKSIEWLSSKALNHDLSYDKIQTQKQIQIPQWQKWQHPEALAVCPQEPSNRIHKQQIKTLLRLNWEHLVSIHPVAGSAKGNGGVPSKAQGNWNNFSLHTRVIIQIHYKKLKKKRIRTNTGKVACPQLRSVIVRPGNKICKLEALFRWPPASTMCTRILNNRQWLKTRNTPFLFSTSIQSRQQ